MTSVTYSVQLIVEWLDKVQIGWIRKPARGPVIYSSGVYITGIDSAGRELTLSVETHPDTAGWAFAETAIGDSAGVVYPEQLGYDAGALRHATPADLFAHICFFVDNVGTMNIDDKSPILELLRQLCLSRNVDAM